MCLLSLVRQFQMVFIQEKTHFYNHNILISEVVLLSMKEGKSSVLPSANEREKGSGSGHYESNLCGFCHFLIVQYGLESRFYALFV